MMGRRVGASRCTATSMCHVCSTSLTLRGRPLSMCLLTFSTAFFISSSVLNSTTLKTKAITHDCASGFMSPHLLIVWFSNMKGSLIDAGEVDGTTYAQPFVDRRQPSKPWKWGKNIQVSKTVVIQTCLQHYNWQTELITCKYHAHTCEASHTKITYWRGHGFTFIHKIHRS